MSNLINTDSAGNVFYNYFTPVISGESTPYATTMLDGLMAAKLGAAGTNWHSINGQITIRFPAGGQEMKTGAISSQLGNARGWFEINRNVINLNSNNTNTSTLNRIGGDSGIASPGIPSEGKVFAVLNDYAFCMAIFNNTVNTLTRFVYIGTTRESVYTGSNYPMGVVGIDSSRPFYQRPSGVNVTTGSILSTAADAITSPPIICTPATNSGSATWTDVVIRDAAAPNNPVGKLWNCVDAPASYTVGRLYKNVGAYDADGSTSEQDIYLCVMPWGERKLLMRVWAENVLS